MSFVGCIRQTKCIEKPKPTEPLSSLVIFQSKDINEFCKHRVDSFHKVVERVGSFNCNNGVLNDWNGLPAAQFFDGTLMYFNSGKLQI